MVSDQLGNEFAVEQERQENKRTIKNKLIIK